MELFCGAICGAILWSYFLVPFSCDMFGSYCIQLKWPFSAITSAIISRGLDINIEYLTGPDCAGCINSDIYMIL